MRRIQNHLSFTKNRIENKKPIKYANNNYNFPVVTSQEREMLFNKMVSFQEVGDNLFEALYSGKLEIPINDNALSNVIRLEQYVPLSKGKRKKTASDQNQLTLFH